MRCVLAAVAIEIWRWAAVGPLAERLLTVLTHANEMRVAVEDENWRRFMSRPMFNEHNTFHSCRPNLSAFNQIMQIRRRVRGYGYRDHRPSDR